MTNLSSTMTSFVRKSAPMVALYWFEKRLLTSWFMSDVFPTLFVPGRLGSVSGNVQGRAWAEARGSERAGRTNGKADGVLARMSLDPSYCGCSRRGEDRKMLTWNEIQLTRYLPE